MMASSRANSNISATASGNREMKRKLDKKKLINLFGSLLMNGYPLVGLDDFVLLSDTANTLLDQTNDTFFRDSLTPSFRNFLDIRHLEFRFSSNNKLTRKFHRFLKNESKIFKVCVVSLCSCIV